MLEVLRLAPDSAYTLEEIVGELLDAGFAVAEVDVQTALTRLVERARVDRTVLFDRAYYSYHRSIGFRPS